MNKLLVMFLIISFLLTNISALCEEGQIDINIASEEKLKEIIHVGPKVAGYIIEKRPFDSIDDLVEVAYISEVYLEDIKEQELACVNGQEEEDEDDKGDIEGESDNNLSGCDEEAAGETSAPAERETINLNPQVIKSEDDNENLSKSNYAVYGLVFFCVLLVVLFILRKNKYNKNEFR